MAKMAGENQDLESQQQYTNHQSSCTFYLKEENEQLFLKAVNRAFKSSAYLKNLLPKGMVLVFQVLSTILSREGECDLNSRLMTAGLVALCGLSYFLLCFTDSFKGIDGDVFHGIATPWGLWVLDANGSSRNSGLEPLQDQLQLAPAGARPARPEWAPRSALHSFELCGGVCRFFGQPDLKRYYESSIPDSLTAAIWFANMESVNKDP
ncbi:hypothetical protein EJ110_NYTH13236 [Nymphaea thermarum]|nr:hypothetical protein EJ110_NYTH13236 [Nymphaea thermarum]